MNDHQNPLAALGGLLGDLRLAADRYDLRMPDGHGRYGPDGVADARWTHARLREGRAAMDALDVELGRIEELMADIWKHAPSAVTDTVGDRYDDALATLSAVRRALAPVDPYSGLPIAERLRLKTRLVNEALLHRGDHAETRQWTSGGPGRLRVLEDVCILLDQVSADPDTPAYMAAQIDQRVEFLRAEQVGRSTALRPTRTRWSDAPTTFMAETMAFVTVIADHLHADSGTAEPA